MEIKIQIRGHIYSICFGKSTEWFQSLWWFCLSEEWYFQNEVIYAKVIKAL